MKKYLTIFLAITFVIFCIPSVSTAETSRPVLESEAAVLMDAGTGQVLFEKNMDEQLYPASITKIMTVLLGAENSNLTDTITMSHDAVYSIGKGSSHIALDTGEQITMEQALMAAMLASANEACNGIAEYISGSNSQFVKLMNQRAVEAGALHTNFANANGLPNDNHVTTAYDMAMITKAALANEQFRRIFGTLKYEIPPTNIQPETRYLWAEHKMVKNGRYEYDGVIGGKTGYTDYAQFTLVTVARRGDRELIAVVLKSSANGIYQDTKTLLDYGFNEFKDTQIMLPAVSTANLTASPDNFSKAQDIVDQFKNVVYTRLLHKNIDAGDIAINYTAVDGPAGANPQIKIDLSLKNSNELMYSNLGSILLESDPPPVTGSTRSKILDIVIVVVKIILGVIIFIIMALFALRWFIRFKKKKRRRYKYVDSRRRREAGFYYYNQNND